MHTLQKRQMLVNALNIKSVLGALDRHVQVAECVVRGHLSMYQDLMVIVESTVRYPTGLQLEACVREAEKLSIMVETSSPRIMADLSLSSLISANPVHELVTNSASSSSAPAVFQMFSTTALASMTLALLVL